MIDQLELVWCLKMTVGQWHLQNQIANVNNACNKTMKFRIDNQYRLIQTRGRPEDINTAKHILLSTESYHYSLYFSSTLSCLQLRISPLTLVKTEMFALYFSFFFHTTLFPTNKTCASCSLPPPGIYWLLSRCQNGLTKQLIISERASVERKKNKFTEAVAWLLGKKYADQSTLGAWECINLKSWDELYT